MGGALKQPPAPHRRSLVRKLSPYRSVLSVGGLFLFLYANIGSTNLPALGCVGALLVVSSEAVLLQRPLGRGARVAGWAAILVFSALAAWEAGKVFGFYG